MAKQLTLYVSGRVQGVFFRDSTKRVAQSLGLKGYVQNLEDGRVKIVAQGNKESLDKLVNWAKGGPDSAKVEGLEEVYSDIEKKFINFTIKF